MNKLTIDDWEIRISQNEVTLSKEERGKIAFSPGNTDSLIKILNIVKPLKLLEVKPEEVNYSPFKVKFPSENFISLNDDKQNILRLHWDEINETCDKIRLAFMKFQDSFKFNPRPKLPQNFRIEGEGETYL